MGKRTERNNDTLLPEFINTQIFFFWRVRISAGRRPANLNISVSAVHRTVHEIAAWRYHR